MIVTSSLSHDKLYRFIKVCGALPQVKNDVIRNHDDNQWWPLAVTDWRLRLILAGWSTRVSYNMISTYQRVVSQANAVGYDQLSMMSDEELGPLVASIGLTHMRIQYFRSVQHFIEHSDMNHRVLTETDNDSLIDIFAARVKGAGYKVAQCAILYAKGYHCGILPVDSGMKNMLGPCLGLVLPKGPIAHEVMRKHIEYMLRARATEYYELAQNLGYSSLALLSNNAPIWWAHLTLIYFKRHYCNNHLPQTCPPRGDQELCEYIGTMCDRQHPRQGGYRDE